MNSFSSSIKKSALFCLLVSSTLVPCLSTARAEDHDNERTGAPRATDYPHAERTRRPLDEEGVGRVFEDTLGREPSRTERRRFQERAERDHWSEAELNEELRATREFRELTPEIVIRHAFRELLDREPDPQSMRTYRRGMIEQGWSAGEVRRAIRESDEFKIRRVDRTIDRAYDDLLERPPDHEGRERYRKFLKEGMAEQEMRDRIKQSVEYRVTLPDSKTTRAYRAVLGRDPDPHGLEHYRKKIVDDRWTEEQVKAELRRSSEFQDRARKKS